MRPLSSVPNIGAPTTSYPDGLIVDNTSGITGTAVTEILYGDLIQTIHKLRRLAGMTANGLPDNETNGFQVLTALLMQGLPHWQPPAANVDFSGVKFVQHTNSVYYHKTSANTSNPPSVDTANWAFVFGWNGTKIVFSNDDAVMSAINQVANDLSARCMTIEGRITNLETGKADWVDVLYKGNTTAFTPTLDYEPATKKFVEDRIKRNIGYYGVDPTSLGAIITDEARAIYNFTLKVTSNRGITLPSKSVLDTYFGYSDGVLLTINCHAESTACITVNGQLINGNGAAEDITLAKGDTLLAMYVQRSSGYDPNWQIINITN